MTRKSKREIERKLDDLDAGRDGGGIAVVYHTEEDELVDRNGDPIDEPVAANIVLNIPYSTHD